MPLVTVLAAEEGPGAAPFLIALIVLVILIGALLGLLAMGKGREHS
ncbi:hypothetical protein GCM10011519_09130 [Marmoricola endophyticus]|uniref:Uncharacterized protein n=1 Tax=Marmoricola endophyticus TaxID=2040280 RepID=A0A917BD24_9ACTN|nr:hypothetical protein [Marmoricola endophyticus]GGF37758.1 hypothetical protein GCM10011519_09130 [Marmoricola endophyticus]